MMEDRVWRKEVNDKRCDMGKFKFSVGSSNPMAYRGQLPTGNGVKQRSVYVPICSRRSRPRSQH